MDVRQCQLYKEIFQKEERARYNNYILIQEQLKSYFSPKAKRPVARTPRPVENKDLEDVNAIGDE